MAYAQELKNLVADIKTSHRDRTKYVADVKDDTHELIARFQGELKEMARDLKDFLTKSETTRKKDFDVIIGAIRARIKDIKGDTAGLLAQFDKEMKELARELKEFLGKSEANRMADFGAMMKDITGTVEAITGATRALLSDYKSERKEAAAHWARLGNREKAVLVPEEVKKEVKKEKKK